METAQETKERKGANSSIESTAVWRNKFGAASDKFNRLYSRLQDEDKINLDQEHNMKKTHHSCRFIVSRDMENIRLYLVDIEKLSPKFAAYMNVHLQKCHACNEFVYNQVAKNFDFWFENRKG